MIKPLFPWFKPIPVLPTVFSDALSYEEQVGVVSAKVNECIKEINDFTPKMQELVDNWLDVHPEATTTVQDGSLTKEKFTTQLSMECLNNYVTPQMYGAKGDGETDDYEAFMDLMNAVYDNGGGIIFIPDGTYILSNTVPIPENTIVMGESHNAILYYDGTVPNFGCALMCGGTNIVVCNLTVNYAEEVLDCLKEGSQLGSIGITTKKFARDTSAINCPPSDTKHILMYNIYSENTNPIHTEGGNYTIEDVRYVNCFAPNGQLRISPVSSGKIMGCSIESCFAKQISIGYNARTSKGISIENCYCYRIKLNDQNIIVNNTVVVAKGVSYINNGTVSLQANAISMMGKNISFNNVLCINDNENVTNGIEIGTAVTSENINFSNVTVDGFTNGIRNTSGKLCNYTNCYFSGTNQAIYGNAINTTANFNYVANISVFDIKYNITVGYASGTTQASSNVPTRFVKLGKTCFVKFCVSVSNLALNQKILSFSNERVKLTEPVTLTGTVFDTSTKVLKPIVIELETNNDINIKYLCGETYTEGSYIISIDSSFVV